MRSPVRMHVALGHQRFTLCGRQLSEEPARPQDVPPEHVVRRDRVDLVAWAFATCGMCRKSLAVEERAAA